MFLAGRSRRLEAGRVSRTAACTPHGIRSSNRDPSLEFPLVRIRKVEMAAMPEHAQASPTRRAVLRAWIFEAFQAIAVILVCPPAFWVGPDFKALPELLS